MSNTTDPGLFNKPSGTGYSLYGTREEKVYFQRRIKIRCGKCWTPTTTSFSYRMSEYGVGPVQFLCAACGGAPRTSEERLIAQIMDSMNRWRILLPKPFVEQAYEEAVGNQKDCKEWKVQGQFKVPAHLGSKLENDWRSRAAEIAAQLLIDQRLGVKLPLRPYSGNIKGADLGTFIQVRCTMSTILKPGRLAIRKKQPHADDIYVLVTYSDPKTIYHEAEFQLRGWLLGKDGMKPEFYEPLDPPPYWAVPHYELHPMETIPVNDYAYQKALH